MRDPNDYVKALAGMRILPILAPAEWREFSAAHRAAGEKLQAAIKAAHREYDDAINTSIRRFEKALVAVVKGDKK